MFGSAQAGASVFVGVSVGVSDGVGVSVGVDVSVGVLLGVTVGVSVGVVVSVNVAVGGMGVSVGSGVFDGFWVGVGGISVSEAQAARKLALTSRIITCHKGCFKVIMNLLLCDDSVDYNEILGKEKRTQVRKFSLIRQTLGCGGALQIWWVLPSELNPCYNRAAFDRRSSRIKLSSRRR
jgi:hypothetical protein